MCTSIKDEYADAAVQGANYRGACILLMQKPFSFSRLCKVLFEFTIYINILESIFLLSLHETKAAGEYLRNFISSSRWAIAGGVLLGLCACAYIGIVFRCDYVDNTKYTNNIIPL
jgi:hypothetical protein